MPEAGNISVSLWTGRANRVIVYWRPRDAKTYCGLVGKISAGSMLIGIFQDRPGAVIFGLVVFVLALKLERSMK